MATEPMFTVFICTVETCKTELFFVQSARTYFATGMCPCCGTEVKRRWWATGNKALVEALVELHASGEDKPEKAPS